MKTWGRGGGDTPNVFLITDQTEVMGNSSLLIYRGPGWSTFSSVKLLSGVLLPSAYFSTLLPLPSETSDPAHPSFVFFLFPPSVTLFNHRWKSCVGLTSCSQLFPPTPERQRRVPASLVDQDRACSTFRASPGGQRW